MVWLADHHTHERMDRPIDKAAEMTAKIFEAPADLQKKKRRKARKETYSSYIYKGMSNSSVL